MELSRRDMLKLGVLGSASLLLPIERIARTKSAANGALDQSLLPDLKYKAVLQPQRPATFTTMDGVDFYDFEMKESLINVLNVPGGRKQNYPLTRVWGYNGEVPGPLIHVDQGRQAVVRHVNGLAGKLHPTLKYEPVLSTHLHGSASLPEYDGYASDVTKPNQYKDYHYPNIQDARTLWYHDHGVHETAANAYMGLAAQYHLHDDNEKSHSAYIPVGKAKVDDGEPIYDVALTIRDAIFGSNGQLIYNDNSESSLMGDVILVNGMPWPTMKVEPRKYRFRILNGSISRSFRPALTRSDTAKSEDLPVWMIGTDGGLMPAPVQVKSWRHGMAERYEIIIDFAPFKGQKLYMKNLGLPNNVDFESTRDIMRFDVGTAAPLSQEGNAPFPSSWTTPYFLNPNREIMGLPDRVGAPEHTFELVRTNGMWTVNGTTWVDVVDSKYGKPLCNDTPGATEIWEIKNPSGGWFHPFHIHLVDFKIISRNGRAPYAWERGPKDVVYVGENETVRIALTLAGPNNEAANKVYADEQARLKADLNIDHTGQRTGRYMMHCHNLIHEDHDMMGQFWVRDPKSTSTSGDVPATEDPHHPVLAAAARPWDAAAKANYAGRPDFDNFRGF
jgi:spore coat protein A